MKHPVVITSRGKTRRKRVRLGLGWRVSETIGIPVVNPRALSKLTKNTVIGIDSNESVGEEVIKKECQKE
jgi:hypothetical protein